MASLVLLQDGQAIPHSLTGQDSVLGRHPECEIQINSNMVSRKHARVFAQDGLFYIEDLGSGNGTFVNSRKIEAPTALNHEDRIKLGPILLRFESDQPAARPGSPTVVPRKPVLDPMATLGVDLGEDDEGDGATIMGQTDGVSGFGRLEVQPEAKLKAAPEDSDGDGMDDIAELAAGRDPNVAGAGDLCGPEYGCGARVEPSGALDGHALLLALGVALALGARVRRRNAPRR